MRGSYNESLENPRDGARSFNNSLILVRIITNYSAVSLSYIHHMLSFLMSIEAKNFCVFRNMEKVSIEQRLITYIYPEYIYIYIFIYT